jgi:hypothetical protein
LPLISGPGGRQGVHGDVFVDVHRLGVLPQIVEPGKAPPAVAAERALPCVLSNWVSISHIKLETNRMWRARCSLRVKLRMQGGYSVQKKRCPFFFFEGRPSPSPLSCSEPSLGGVSSATGSGLISGSTRVGVGVAGVSMCRKLSRVGVLTDDSSMASASTTGTSLFTARNADMMFVSREETKIEWREQGGGMGQRYFWKPGSSEGQRQAVLG